MEKINTTDKVQVYYLDENGRIVPSTMTELLELNGNGTLPTPNLPANIATHCPFMKDERKHDWVYARNALSNGHYYKTCRHCGFMAEAGERLDSTTSQIDLQAPRILGDDFMYFNG